jgi:hypothetical protein
VSAAAGIHTEATLKARHQEALDIFHAWVDRRRVTGGHSVIVVDLQMNEAWDWVERTAEDLRLYREVTRSAKRAARKVSA